MPATPTAVSAAQPTSTGPTPATSARIGSASEPSVDGGRGGLEHADRAAADRVGHDALDQRGVHHVEQQQAGHGDAHRQHGHDQVAREGQPAKADGAGGPADRERKPEAPREERAPGHAGDHATDADGGVQVTGAGFAGAEDVDCAMTTVSTASPPPTRLVVASSTNGPASGPASCRHPACAGAASVPASSSSAEIGAAARETGRRHSTTATTRERDRVEQEGDLQRASGQQEAGEGRPEDEGEVVERGPRAVGRAQVALVDQHWQQGGDGGAEEGREAGGQDRERRRSRASGHRRSPPPTRTSMMMPRATSVTSRTMRRSNRSATIPAGTDSRTYGRMRAAPTMPEQHRRVALRVDDDQDRRPGRASRRCPR